MFDSLNPLKVLKPIKDFADKIIGEGEAAKSKQSDKPSGILGSLAHTPAVAAKLGEQAEASKAKRQTLFGEVWESIVARYFPNFSKFLDLGTGLKLFQKEDEAHRFQNEFEFVTAMTLLIPDFMLRKVTDPIAESETFLTVLEHWPVKGKEFADKIRAKKNPDDVVSALRMMHQDMVTSKILVSEVISKIMGK